MFKLRDVSNMWVRTLETFLKSRDLSQAELARLIGVSRQAVSLWFRQKEANLHSRHLLRLSAVLDVPVEDLVKPLPCFDTETHERLLAELLWDRLYPDLDDFAIALSASEPRAIGRLVEVYGLYAAAKALGDRVWQEFPSYKRFIHPARRRELERLWVWHEGQRAA